MFKHHGPGWMSYKPAKVLSNIFQSNTEGLNTDTFCLAVTTVKLPKGTGRQTSKRYNNFTEECKKRQGIVIVINNKDNLCLPRFHGR